MRAKFKLNSITRQLDYYGKEQWSIKLSPVSKQDAEGNDENKRFWEATPSGSIEFICCIKNAVDSMELGEMYYVDFTKAS